MYVIMYANVRKCTKMMLQLTYNSFVIPRAERGIFFVQKKIKALHFDRALYSKYCIKILFENRSKALLLQLKRLLQ